MGEQKRNSQLDWEPEFLTFVFIKSNEVLIAMEMLAISEAYFIKPTIE